MRRRIRKELTCQSSSRVQTNEVRYVYDGNLVIQERDALNAPVVTYTRGKDLSGSLEGAGGIGGLLARTDERAKSAAFYHSDRLGNVTMLVSAQQIPVAKYLYDPFGNTLSLSGPLAEANLYRFSTKEVHPNSGLVYYLYRYYSPNLQRWPNRDPFTDVGFAYRHSRGKGKRIKARLALEALRNPYSFVHNEPLAKVDPFGLKYSPEECAGLLNEIDFLFSIIGRTGIDANSVMQQIIDLEDEYDENCGDDDDGHRPPIPAPDPVPSCPKKETEQAPSFCEQHPVICAVGGAVVVAGVVVAIVLSDGTVLILAPAF
jgi:RHS repeat-associated protein